MDDDVSDIGEDIDDIGLESFNEDDIGDLEPEPSIVEDDTADVGPEPIIIEAIHMNEHALTELFEHPWMIRLLNEIAEWAQWKYQQNKEDFRQILSLRIYLNIYTLNNPRRLRPWCYSIARNDCLNQVKHRRVANSYLELSRRQSQESTRQGGRPFVQCSAVLTPEQELLQKEQELLRKEQDILFEKKIRKITSSFPPEIVDGWLEGIPRKEIAKTLGRSVQTVYRLLNEMHKAIVKEFRDGQQGKKNDI